LKKVILRCHSRKKTFKNAEKMNKKLQSKENLKEYNFKENNK